MTSIQPTKRPPLTLMMVGLLTLWLAPGTPRAQPEVEDLLDQIKALAGGLLGGTDPDQLPAVLAAELPAVEREAGMTAGGPVPMRVVTRAEAAAHVAALVAEQLPPKRIGALELAWHALGLLPGDVGLRETIEGLYSSQAGGYYDPARKELVLLGDLPGLLQVPVVRHELVHALQDRTWDLGKWLGDAALDEDRAAAVQAVLEGQATVITNRVTWQQLGGGSPGAADALAEALGTDPGDLDLSSLLDEGAALGLLPRNVPAALQVQLLFPYTVGASFVSGYLAAHPEDRSCSKLFERPPRSTAEVLWPGRWTEGFVPELSKAGTFVPGWTLLHDTALGRLLTWVLLTGEADASAGDTYGGRWGTPDRDRRVVVGSGWRGDRVAVWSIPTQSPGTAVPDTQIVTWIARWRDEAEGTAVLGLARRRPAMQAANVLLEQRGDRTAVVVGGDAATRKRAADAIFAWR